MSDATEAIPKAESPAAGATSFQPLNWWKAVLLALGATACFHAAYTPANPGPLALLIVGYVVCLVQLARLRTTRRSFYTGLLTGLLCVAPQMECFWRMFGPAAIALWTVLAFWIGLFVAFAHVALIRLGVKRAVWLIPFLWTGLEYFRSELYYLKFSWLNVGFAFAQAGYLPFRILGVYGVGFFISGYAAGYFVVRTRRILYCSFIVLLLAVVVQLTGFSVYLDKVHWRLQIAGLQLEFPDVGPLKQALDQITTTNTNMDLIVLSEYTLDGPPPDLLKQWYRDHGKFLIVGGKDYTTNKNFYDTAFIISTNGDVIFKQVKSVPVQLFKDGLPATEQKLWNSPWGKIGVCICYDLSYARVTDELVRQGAQLLIVPTMDVETWGRHQHELHARIAPVRAAEYGIPIFRVASSGISQGVSSSGNVSTTAPFPGEGEMIFYGANLDHKGSLPMDRYLAPLAVFVTGAFIVWLMVTSRKTRINAPQPPP